MAYEITRFGPTGEPLDYATRVRSDAADRVFESMVYDLIAASAGLDTGAGRAAMDRATSKPAESFFFVVYHKESRVEFRRITARDWRVETAGHDAAGRPGHYRVVRGFGLDAETAGSFVPDLNTAGDREAKRLAAAGLAAWLNGTERGRLRVAIL